MAKKRTATGETFKALLQQKILQKKGKLKPKNATLLYPTAIQAKYTRDLRRIMRQFTQITVQEMKPLLREWKRQNKEATGDGLRYDSLSDDEKKKIKDVWVDELADLSDEYRSLQDEIFITNKKNLNAQLMAIAASVSAFNKAQWQKYLKQSVGVEIALVEPWEDLFLKTWTARNVNLIKGMTNDYVKKINEAVLEGFQKGITADALAKDLSQINRSFTKNRTKLIARDQIGKLNGQLTKKRQTEAGLEFYRWNTALDERVRGRPGGRWPKGKPSHWALEGKICRWDDSTIYADSIEDAQAGNWKRRSSIKAEQQHPGEAINCRCFGEPIFTEVVEEIANEEAA